MKTRFLLAAVVLLATLSALGTAKASERQTATTAQPATTDCATFLAYSNDPSQIWNRVHRMLLVRTAPDGSLWGCDEVDPLLWDRTQHVLVGEKYKPAVQVLDEFIATHAERQIRDPLKRALFQRNLWAFFNWVSPTQWPGLTDRDRREMHFAARQEIAGRVAAMIKAVALSRDQIDLLPDNFARLRGTTTADGLQLPGGEGWILISRDDGSPAATDHMASFPRSAFFSYLRLAPGGPKSGDYLDALREYSRMRDRQAQCIFPFDCNPPQFGIGTEVALVRRAMLIDSDGQPVLSPIVESIQLRRYLRIPTKAGDGPLFSDTQHFAEFRLSQAAMLSGKPSLRRVGEQETEFVTFHSHGIDGFEMRSHEAQKIVGVAQRSRFFPSHLALACSGCHQNPGVKSFTSYSRMQFAQSKDQFVMVHASNDAEETAAAIREVESQPKWKDLERLMKSLSHTSRAQ